MASVFLYHVVGDLTLGKPELVEFDDTGTVESAAKAIAECSEGSVTVWKKRGGGGGGGGGVGQLGKEEDPRARTARAGRFVGMLNALDLVSFMATVGDHEKAMKTPVSEIVVPNGGLLKEVDPHTRLIDALEMMKQGVRRLLVRKSTQWKGMSKRFSVIYNGKWLKNIETSGNLTSTSSFHGTTAATTTTAKFCCLSREDVIRFIICCLGALNPIPLSSISVLGAITKDYISTEASSPATESIQKLSLLDPCSVAVVETNPDGSRRIIGEISAYKLWKCDYLSAAWAMANLSAGQFVMGANDNTSLPLSSPDCAGDDSLKKKTDTPPWPADGGRGGGSTRLRKFSSRNLGFVSKPPNTGDLMGNMYRGRSAPLMCKNTSSLAAVMAQMLSHRATHVWVTEADSDDVLVGIVGYTDILHAVTTNVASSSGGTASSITPL